MRPSIAAAPSGEKTHSDDSDDDNAEPEIISHIKYKIGAVYWRHGFSLPENGRIKLSNDELSFKGILGTKLSFDLKDVDIEKASRLGGLIHDAFIISVENSKEEGKEFTFSTGLKDTKKVIDKIQSAIANAKQDESHEKSRVWGPDDLKKDNQFRVPAPDPTLEKMKIIAERRLKGVDLQDYYKVAWSDEKPIYEPFLKGQGKNNVNVAHWETGKFEGDWCGETYTEKRIVSFDFMKQTIGQSLVEVKHTQHCRRTDNEQCIVQIKMEMKGFPYADCFVVEVRHVASCVGRNDLKIQIGMHVKFLKSCMFEKKIRTNTGAETTNAQLALLEMTLKGCAPYAKSAAKKERFRMPPDTTLTEMTIIGERKLKGVSIQDYREVAWSDKTPMYAPFLEQQGKNNVNVLPWEIGEFKGDWCGETYKEKRIVSFDFMKQTIGQTLVEVKHTQQLRRQDNDQCIVQIKMEMKGFPYADCFVVEVRHVASRVGKHDLKIQIGMYVKFLKSCMFEKKIRNNTGAETTKAQLALLEMILKGCVPYVKEIKDSAEESDDDADPDEELEFALTAEAQQAVARKPFQLPDPLFKALRFIMTSFISIFCTYVRPYAQPGLFDPFPPSTVEEALRSTRVSTKLLEKISLKSASESDRKDVVRQIALIAKSIDKIEKMTAKSSIHES